MQNDLLLIQNTSADSTEYEEKFVNLTANKVVFVDINNLPTTTGIGLSSQFLKADGSLDSTTYENVANKVTSFQVAPDNTHYASEKLTKDSLDLKIPYTGATADLDLGLNSLNANTIKLDGTELLIDAFKFGSLGTAGNIFYSTGASSQPASGTVNQVMANNLLNPNTVVKWDGSKFANSGIIDDGTKVGIGTTTPYVGLHNAKRYLFISNPDFILGSTGSGVVVGLGANSGETHSFIQATQYGDGYAAPLVIQPNGGNVGISKTDPSESLDVNGNAIADVLKSRVLTGTAPIVVASTTKVDSLNVGLLDGKKASDFLKYDDDSIKIMSLNPEITLKQDISNEEWRIGCGIGTGVANGAFNVYNNRIGKYAISFNSDGDCIIGDKVPEYNGYSRLLVHGGSTGANIDAIGIPGNFTDQATFEAMGSDYFTEFRSAYLQYMGATHSGTTLGHSNSNLARLVLNGDNNLIYTNKNQSIDFWSNSSEHLRVGTTNGSYFLTNVGIGADASPNVKLSIAEKTGINEIGGVMVKLTNKTGANSVKGTVVYINPSVDNAFGVNPINGDMPFGVAYESGIADGSECWIVVSGIAEVLLVNTIASTRSYVAYSSGSVAGRIDIAASVPAATTHFREIGHTLESKVGGTNVLCKCVLHFN